MCICVIEREREREGERERESCLCVCIYTYISNICLSVHQPVEITFRVCYWQDMGLGILKGLIIGAPLRLEYRMRMIECTLCKPGHDDLVDVQVI